MAEGPTPDRNSTSSTTGNAAVEPHLLPALLRLCRPRQWTKNLLLFAALVFAVKLTDPESLALALLAFVSFCLASSSVYVVNDLIDVDRDREHPVKRHRPIASGVVAPGLAMALAAVLTLGSMGLALWIGTPFAVSVALYIGMTHFYSFVGKNIVILDTMLVATGFVIRAIAGAVAIDVPYSNWFILCTFFAASFLALSKRKGEILALDSETRASRPVLQQYSIESLTSLSVVSVAALLLSYALYVISEAEKSGSQFHLLELTFPFVMYGVFRYYLLVDTAGVGETPEEVLLSDRPIQLAGLGFGLVALIALYFGI